MTTPKKSTGKADMKLAKLPGHHSIWLDPSVISCVRIEIGEHGTVVVIHTTEGYAVAQQPEEDQTAVKLANQIMSLIP